MSGIDDAIFAGVDEAIAASVKHAQQARMASAWGQPTIASHEMSRAYRNLFEARTADPFAQIPESAWSAAGAGFQRRMLPPTSPYLATWSPAVEGSGIRGQDTGPALDFDAIAEQVSSEMFRV